MTDPLRPARIQFSAGAAPHSLDFDDTYHAQAGAHAQALHVFLGGNGLPGRWAGRPDFVILETGFGLGQNFLATWAAWRDDAQRCARLWFLAIEKHPPTSADLRRALATSPEPELAGHLLAAWPPVTADLHCLDFTGGRVRLMLAFGDVAHWLPQLHAQVDAFYLDGFAPAKNPAMWEPQVLKRLRHLAHDGATAATWSVARVVREALDEAGFAVERQPGFDSKREMLVARFAPRYALQQPAGRRSGVPGRVAVVGAGLAGAAVARALMRQDVSVIVFEREGDVALGASGNPGGLLHGVVHGADGPHARWHRVAALHAAHVVRPLIASGVVSGALNGLLRLERRFDVPAMHRLLQQLALPGDYVTALTREDASERAGTQLAHPAWYYGAAGWIDPRTLVRAWLDQAGVEVRHGTLVQRLQRDDHGHWRLFDAQDRCLAEVEHVVLANAHDALRLAGASDWPLRKSRGQITLLNPATPDCPALALPVAGDGYALTLPSGELLCGATSDLDDQDAQLREADHRRNLDALATLTGRTLDPDRNVLRGRVGWRLHTPDRLPLVGPLPDAAALDGARQDQPRFIARQPGLHVLAALGSRGLVHAALAGEVLASWITGAPQPVGSALLDAIDVARFAARARRVRT